MEIQEYRPEPSKQPPPKPERKELSVFKLGIFMVVTFFVTLAVLGRHDLAAFLKRQHEARPIQAAQMPLPKIKAIVPDSRSIERMQACLSSEALNAEDLAQVRQALHAQVIAAEPPATPALNEESPDVRAISNRQAAEFAGMLTRISGTLGDRARMAFQRGIAEGTCGLASQTPPPTLSSPKWPGSKVQ